MSVTELIEQLKALSAEEQEAFGRLFREFESRTPLAASKGNHTSASRDSNWPDFGSRLKGIYGSKVVADSGAVISYLRGER